MFKFIARLLGHDHDPELAEAEAKTTADGEHVPRRFVFGLLAISNQVDPAYRVAFSRMAVADWYGIHDRDDLILRINEYVEGGLSTPAYDAFRAAFLARAGVAAGYLTQEASWQLGLGAVRRVQQVYDGWMAYGVGYLDGHLEYRRGEGDDHETLKERKASVMRQMSECSAGIWGRTPFTLAV